MNLKIVMHTGHDALALRRGPSKCAIDSCWCEQGGRLPVCPVHAAAVPRRMKSKLLELLDDPRSEPQDLSGQCFEIVGRSFRAVCAAPAN